MQKTTNIACDPRFGNLTRLACPLILTALSSQAMMFIDRIILGQHSLSAMNSAAIAGITAATFYFFGISVAGISEVFVGQLHGSGENKKEAQPVWQMIWFALMLNILFLPLVLYTPDFILPQSAKAQGLPYFRIIMSASSIMAITSALTGFFVARGHALTVTIAAIIGNIVNLGLDIVLILGIKSLIAPMGTVGAAIATVVGAFIQMMILAVVFLQRSNRIQSFTHRAQLNWKMLWQCLSVGVPQAMGFLIELAAWSVLMRIMANASWLHLTMMTVVQGIFHIFSFFGEGLRKAVTAIAANLIGSEKTLQIKTLLYNAGILYAVSLAIMMIPMLFFPQNLVALFMNANLPYDQSQIILMTVPLAIRLLMFYLIFDGFAWIIAAVLIAGGDTKYIMLVNAFAVWLGALVPTYILTNIIGAGPVLSWSMILIYGIINATFMFYRFRSGKWLKLDLKTKN